MEPSWTQVIFSTSLSPLPGYQPLLVSCILDSQAESSNIAVMAVITSNDPGFTPEQTALGLFFSP